MEEISTSVVDWNISPALFSIWKKAIYDTPTNCCGVRLKYQDISLHLSLKWHLQAFCGNSHNHTIVAVAVGFIQKKYTVYTPIMYQRYHNVAFALLNAMNSASVVTACCAIPGHKSGSFAVLKSLVAGSCFRFVFASCHLVAKINC